MKTNFQMLKELLDVYRPKERGIVHMQEIRLIDKTLCLNEMDVLQLRNMRDFTVLYINSTMDDALMDDTLEKMDKISAITSVIDSMIVRKGGEV